VRDWTDLAEGEAFTDADVRAAECVCLIGQTPLRELFEGESPLGKQVRVNGVPLRVLGVLRGKGPNMMGLDQDDLILAPWTTVQFRINGLKQSLADLKALAGPSLGKVNTLSQLYPGAQGPPYPQRTPSQQANTPQMVRFAYLDDIYISAVSPEAIPQA